MPTPSQSPRQPGRRPAALRRARLALIAAFPAAVACGEGGGGCGGCGGEPSGTFPDKARVIGGVQARLSEDGFGFLGDNLQPILEGFLPDGLGTCVAGQETRGPLGGEYGYCTENVCADGTPGCPLTMEIERARFATSPPDTVAVSIDIAAFRFLLDAKVKPFGLAFIDCDITLSSPAFPVTVPLVLRIEAPDDRLGFTLGDPDFDLANLELELQGTLACDIINTIFSLDFIEDLLFSAINQPVKDAVHGFAEEQLCLPCGDNGECPAGAACGAGDLCRIEAEGGRCVGKGFTAEGELDAASLLAGFLRGEPSPLRYLAQPGGFVHVEGGGVTLGVIAGTAAEPSDCVPRTNPPPAVRSDAATALRGNLDPDGDPFDVALGVHESLLDRTVWTAFDAGLLCLMVDSSLTEFLSTATLGLLLPSLKALTEGQARPMMLVLAPQSPPVVEVGAGTLTEDPDDPGVFTMDDPLLTVGLRDLGIHFYTLVDERWIRVFTLDVDIDLPVGLAVVEGGALLPVLGDLTEAVTRIDVRNDELLAGDSAQLAGLLPNLLGLALPLLGDSLLSPIEIPPLMGFRLSVQSVQGIEDATLLGLFASLGLAPAEPPALAKRTVRARTSAALLRVDMPPSPTWGERPRDAWPRARLDVSGSTAAGVDADRLEYQVRVDRTGWSLFQRAPGGVLTVRHPILIAEGDHRVQVRARVAGLPGSLDPDAALVTVPIAWPRASSRVGVQGFHGRVSRPVSDAAGDAGGCQCDAGRRAEGRGAASPIWAPRSPGVALLLLLLSTGCEDERPRGYVDRPAGEPGGEGEGEGEGGPCPDAPAADCSLHACEPGFVSELGGQGTVDPATCERVGVVCRCVEGPPSPFGDVGRHVDVARRPGGGLLYAAYNGHYGDLMFAAVREARLPEAAEWTFVDGVPADAPVRGAPSGPRGGVEKPGPDVGRYATIGAVGGGVLIAYRDDAGDTLRLARGVLAADSPATWAFDTLDDTPEAGVHGRMSVGADGSVALAYRVAPTLDGDRKSGLRVAFAADGIRFVRHDVELVSQGLPCGGACSGRERCVLAEQACARPSGSCPGGCKDDEACYEGACKRVHVDDGLVGLRRGAPVGIAVARDPAGRLAVAWHDRGAGTLRLAYVTADGVNEGPITVAGQVAEGMTPGEEGRHPALWIDADGATHLAWVDAGRDQLKHLRLGDAAPSLVDDGRRTSPSGRVSENLVGGDCRVVRDRSGQLVVLYQDQTFLDLLAATRREDGWWFETLAGHETPYTGAFGFYTRALPALPGEPGALLIVTFRYDNRSDPPAHGLALRWR